MISNIFMWLELSQVLQRWTLSLSGVLGHSISSSSCGKAKERNTFSSQFNNAGVGEEFEVVSSGDNMT